MQGYIGEIQDEYQIMRIQVPNYIPCGGKSVLYQEASGDNTDVMNQLVRVEETVLLEGTKKE